MADHGYNYTARLVETMDAYAQVVAERAERNHEVTSSPQAAQVTEEGRSMRLDQELERMADEATRRIPHDVTAERRAMSVELWHGEGRSAILANGTVVEYERNTHKHESESDYQTLITELHTYGDAAARAVLDYLVTARKVK